MPTDAITAKSGIKYSDKPETPTTLNAKTGEETQKAASLNSDSKETLLRAQQSALQAKEAALGAINRFYQESKASEMKAGKMLGELEEALQLALSAAKKTRGIGTKEASQQSGQSAIVPHDKKNSRSAMKVMHTSPFGIVSDLKKSLLGTKPTAEEIKEEFYRVVMRKSPQLRQLIDDLTEEKARVKTNKIIAEAKSEIAAARVAVSKAQEEVRVAREEAKKACLDAENARKSAGMNALQVKEEAVNEVACKQPEIQNNGKPLEQTAELDKEKEALILAREKVKKESEELRALRIQAMVAVKKAQDQEKKARAEADAMRLEAQQAIEKAASERQQAQTDIELARKAIQQASAIAEKLAYDKFLGEIKKLREEVDITNAKAHEAIARARSESQRAKQELEIMKKACEKEIDAARRETLEAQNEVERVKKAMFEVINQSQETSRRVQKEAEDNLKLANQALMQAKKDIVNMTRDEIIKSRQDFEEPQTTLKPGEVTTVQPGQAKLDAENIATVLHEIRTPLHSISGFAKLLKEDNISDAKTRKEFLSIVEQQTENLNKLIDDLSSILNNKSEVLSVKNESVSSHKIITEAVDSVQTIAQQKKNLIIHELASDLPEINIDVSRIKQVITNLLTNAIKFSPENSPILVKAQIKDNALLVQVIDHGIGIPGAELSAIFDKHYQATNRGNVAGDGLGLYICRQIINSYGGKIWAESVEGQGSTFCFSLPVNMAATHENKQVETSHAE